MLVHADQQQRRLRGHRADRVAGEPGWPPVNAESGDDGYAGSEGSEQRTELLVVDHDAIPFHRADPGGFRWSPAGFSAGPRPVPVRRAARRDCRQLSQPYSWAIRTASTRFLALSLATTVVR